MRKMILAATLLSLVVTPLAHAGTSTLTLRRAALTNVSDPAGSWQYEGGTVWQGGRQVGYFGVTRRMIPGGTNALNTSMFTLTLFFSGSVPYRNVTLQGAWNFGPGNAIGGVSAASMPFPFLMHDGTFSMTGAAGGIYTLIINWTGGGAVP